MIPRDVRYTVTSLPMQAGSVPAPSPSPSPTPIVALENVPSTLTVNVQSAAQVRNVGTVNATWAIAVSGSLTVNPSSGTLAPGATMPLALNAFGAGNCAMVLTVTGGSATGTPASIVASGVVPPPPPSPTLTLSALGGLTTQVGTPLNFGVVLANPATLPLVGTPENVTGAGVFVPTTVSWSLGDLNKAFAATWAAAGSKSIRVTAPGGLVSNTLSVTVNAAPPPPPPAPTLATLSGSSSATVGVAHVDTVSLDVPADQTYTVSWTRSNGATGPATSTINAGQTAATGSSTWAAAGSGRTVDFTISPSLTRAGRPLPVTVAAAPGPTPPPPPGSYSDPDWITRKSGAAVIAAHAFDYDAEVTQHLVGSTDPTDHPVPVRRVVDPAGFGCLEQVVIGAELAAPYTAGNPTATFNDLTMWPDPAVDGPFAFMMAKAWPASPDKNLFTCTARSGNTLTIVRQTGTGSAFAPTAQSYAVGDYAGNENSREWRRTFAALPAGENGLTSDDPGASGAVPLRSKLSGNAYSVPRDASYWQYGWYGHPSNQATWANWTGWLNGSSTLTPRGVAQGAAAKYRLWDGDTIYIQFRIKFDPRFLDNHSQPDPASTQYWIRKTFALQSEVSSLNQLVVDQGPATIWDIPATPGMGFRLGVHKDSKVIGATDWARPAAPAAGHPSYQGGSPWDVAPHYADLRSSGKPATGCATPDGAAAWKMPSGEWFTVHMRIKPGRSDVAESQIKIEIARQDQAGYTGAYTTVLDVTDAKIVFSGSGDYSYPDGAFSYPTVQRMDALPGYQSFGLMGYLNLFQAAGWVPPRRSYYIRMAQVIFSQAPIPAPAVPAIQISGSNWTPNVDGSGVILDTDWAQLPLNQYVYAVTNQMTDAIGPVAYQTSVGNADGRGSICTAWSGAAFNHVTQEIHSSGGGHNDSHLCENGIYGLAANTLRFTVTMPRSAKTAGLKYDGGTNTYIPQASGAVGAGSTNSPQADGAPGATHTYHALDLIQPGDAGNTNGAIVMFTESPAVADLDTQTYDTAYHNPATALAEITDLSYKIGFSHGWDYFHLRGNFYVRLWDFAPGVRTATLWSSEVSDVSGSRGRFVGQFGLGANYVYNKHAHGHLNQRREIVNFQDGGPVRVRYGEAVDAPAYAAWKADPVTNYLYSWAAYVDTPSLTSSDGSHTTLTTEANFSDVSPGTGAPLYAAGVAYSATHNCIYVMSISAGGPTYKVTGISTNTWTSQIVAGATNLTQCVNGMFGRGQLVRKGGVDVLVRISSVTGYPEVMRVSDN